jgi:hypothetical protein
MINREVRNGRCFDLSGATKDKLVYSTREEARLNSIQWPDQEPYSCLDSGDLHWHCRTIEKHIQREVDHALGNSVPITRILTRSDKISDRRAKVQTLFDDGIVSIVAIAKALRTSKNTIRKDFGKLRLKAPKTGSVEKRRDMVVLLAHDGKSPAEMAQELKVSIFTIRKDLKVRNITAARKRRVKDACGLPHRRVSTGEMFRAIIERLERIEKLLI